MPCPTAVKAFDLLSDAIVSAAANALYKKCAEVRVAETVQQPFHLTLELVPVVFNRIPIHTETKSFCDLNASLVE
jgi:hypothetical protein